jgi:hypothetical protein
MLLPGGIQKGMGLSCTLQTVAALRSGEIRRPGVDN